MKLDNKSEDGLQNLNDLVKESSFLLEAIELATTFCESITINIGDSVIDKMTSIFTLCNDYETRYQSIVKKALDEALAKIRAKNDLNSIAQDFIPDYDLEETMP